MPFALADLTVIAGAVAVFLILVAADWMISHAQSVVPAIDILGIHVFGWLDDWLDDLHDWIAASEDGTSEVLKWAITDTGWILSRIAGAAMEATENLLNLVRHVSNVVVVDAENAAKTFAVDIVGGLDTQAQIWYHDALSNAATLATNLQNNIDNVIDTTIPQAVSVALHTAESDLATDVTNLQNNITTVADSLANDLSYLEGILGPLGVAVYTTLPGQLAALAEQEKSDNAATASQAEANLSTAINSLEAQIGGVNQGLLEQTVALQSANAAIASLDTTAADYGQQLNTLQSDAATASTAIDSLTNQADGLKTQLTAAQGQINTLQQTEAITLPALPDVTIPGSLVVPLAVGGLATVVADIATEIESCMVSVCDGPNNYANLLQTLLGGIDLASMALFLGEAIKNPSGTAGTFAALGEGLYNDADSFIDGLLSL